MDNNLNSKTHLNDLIGKSEEELAKLASSAAVLKLLAEIDQAKANIRKCESDIKKNEKDIKDSSWKWISIITPLIAAITVIVTVYEFTNTNRQQKEQKEEAQWSELVKKLSNPDNITNDFTIPTTLKMSLSSEQFGAPAMEITRNMLAKTYNRITFGALYAVAYPKITPENFKDQVGLTARLSANYFDRHGDANLLRSQAGGTVTNAAAIAKDDSLAYEANMENNMVSDSICAFLARQPDFLTKGHVSLDGVVLLNGKLSNVDFGDASIKSSLFIFCDVKDANLGGIHDFSDTNWDRTAWWEAKNISHGLLKHLVKNYPYSSGKNYKNEKPFNEQKYNYWLGVNDTKHMTLGGVSN